MEHELVMLVRKELAIALRDLLQHGLMEVSSRLCGYGSIYRFNSKMQQEQVIIHTLVKLKFRIQPV